jgi:transketolase
MPSWELFEEQDESYQEEVLPAAVTKRVAVEAGVTLGWERYTGTAGAIIGLDHFGASAPAEVLFEKFGFTVEKVLEKARALLAG